MPSWKKVIVSGSDASLNSVKVANGATVTGSVTVSGSTGTIFSANVDTLIFTGSASISGSLSVTNSITASFFTGSVRATYLTASGLIYPTTDGAPGQFIVTNGTGSLTFDDVHVISEAVRYGENISIGDPLYVSGSNGTTPIVYRADAAVASKMPVIYIASSTAAANTNTTAITLGLITGVTTTGYPAGTTVYVGEGGGWTSNRPTGSSSIVQPLGIVTKEGPGGSGRGLVLNPGPVLLPNLQTGYTWIGDGTNQPVAISTSSIQNVVSSSYALTASYIAGGGGSGDGFPYSGSASITGSLNILAPNGYANDYADNYFELGSAATLQGSLILTGSLELANNYTMSADYVNVGEVLKLNNSNPLPTAGVGLLAVSESNLYYSNGITWTQIN